ncbi:LuxR C-terminal-related transcriptional regulator [Dokdonia ponticola]|uniref:LuxR C-terminal-related transcriptional regulator n=1 Tax=Dokdonia ponticola TaxID=2041041 RepID=A0ABV9I4E0_9FLAO
MQDILKVDEKTKNLFPDKELWRNKYRIINKFDEDSWLRVLKKSFHYKVLQEKNFNFLIYPEQANNSAKLIIAILTSHKLSINTKLRHVKSILIHYIVESFEKSKSKYKTSLNKKDFSSQEIQLLYCFYQGLKTKKIEKKLKISTKELKIIDKRLLKKFNVKCHFTTLKIALYNGFLDTQVRFDFTSQKRLINENTRKIYNMCTVESKYTYEEMTLLLMEELSNIFRKIEAEYLLKF